MNTNPNDDPLHPLHVISKLVAFVSPLPCCDVCDEHDASVSGGYDREGVAVPATCGTCRCKHSPHDEDCRERVGYCHGCVAEEAGYSVPHTCGVSYEIDAGGWVVRREAP